MFPQVWIWPLFATASKTPYIRRVTSCFLFSHESRFNDYGVLRYGLQNVPREHADCTARDVRVKRS
jgi:hypothetical protein